MSENPSEVIGTIVILEMARDLIAKPGAWCRGHLAKSARGKPCHTLSPLATQFCMLGACARAVGSHSPPIRCSDALAKTLRYDRYSLSLAVSYWNDQVVTEQAAVVQLFDDTIQRLREQGA